MEPDSSVAVPWYQFDTALKILALELEIKGGLTFDFPGISLSVTKSFYYYGLVHFSFLILFLFLDIHIVNWKRDEAEKSKWRH